MEQLLVVTLAFVLTIGATARITRLVTDDRITETLRDAVLHRLTYDPQQRAALDAHHQAVTDALTAHEPAPLTPAIPPAENPARANRNAWFAWLLTCRWCASIWTSVLTTIAARLALTAHGPLWTPIALTWVDLLIVPAAIGAVAYFVGWLAERE